MARTTPTTPAKAPAAQSANVWINIRAVLALLVIIYHSTMIYSDPDGMYPTSRRLEFSGPGSPLATVIGVGFISMMPLFFGLAGSSMVYTLRKSTSYAVLMRKKLYRLVIPWLFIGLCWSIPLRFATHNPQFRGLSFGRILWETFVTGNFSDNLWFLQVLFLMFVVTGLPYQLFRLTDRADVAVAVWSVFVFFASVAGNHVLESQGMTSKAVSSFIANLPFFVAGLLAHRQWARIRRVLFAPRVRIISIALLVVAYALMFLIAMRVSDGLVHMYAMQIAAMPVPLAIAAVMPRRTNRAMSLIGRNLLSLYLMHLPLVYVSFAYWPNIDPWLMILINVCCLSMVVMLFAEMLRRLHLGVLIGEKGYRL